MNDVQALNEAVELEQELAHLQALRTYTIAEFDDDAAVDRLDEQIRELEEMM